MSRTVTLLQLRTDIAAQCESLGLRVVIDDRVGVSPGVKFKDAALVAAAVLSNRYITDRFLPDKAIDLVDEAHATGRCYFAVLTDIGLDHWGRYVDDYRRVDDRWVFASRSVTLDGQVSGSLFPRTVD